ncbi:cytochrome c [Panacibacter ginsenosidivorans]|uniref:Cytochrome c n=1 Tax=Panacibacter ginsenosidivorans TaxID=1813871 RepID=A0A5B8VEN9_9BACT|nr:cytochrome c [Panacibacter ginsenosidivorans]QEC69513.1 cytochrome c [Panacibacter ginsenosidivorans]
MKKSIIISFIIFITAIFSIAMSSCSVSKKVADKSGAQLWAENCNRCHNAPGPGEFNNDNWEIVGMHMQVRANLTQTDITKVIDFLKSANN